MVIMLRRIFTGMLLIGIAIYYVLLVIPQSSIRIGAPALGDYWSWVVVLQVCIGGWLGIKYSSYIDAHSIEMWNENDSDRYSLLRESIFVLPYILTCGATVGEFGTVGVWTTFFPLLVTYAFTGIFWLGVLSLKRAIATR
jgi:hypothetical protein